MRLLHVVVFSKKLRWLAQTKVITLKTQLHAVNASVKRQSQRSFTLFSELTLVGTETCDNTTISAKMSSV